jgi:hypothetical protein
MGFRMELQGCTVTFLNTKRVHRKLIPALWISLSDDLHEHSFSCLRQHASNNLTLLLPNKILLLQMFFHSPRRVFHHSWNLLHFPLNSQFSRWILKKSPSKSYLLMLKCLGRIQGVIVPKIIFLLSIPQHIAKNLYHRKRFQGNTKRSHDLLHIDHKLRTSFQAQEKCPITQIL